METEYVIQRRVWRVERQARSRGPYFVLVSGRSAFRATIAIGFVGRVAAERARVGMSRLVERVDADIAIEMLTAEPSTSERVALLHRMLAIVDRPPDPAWFAGQVEPGKMTLAGYVATYFGPERQRARPASWAREQGTWSRYLLPTLGDVVLGELDAVRFDTLMREVRGVRGGAMSGNTLRLVRAAYQACLRFAERRGHLSAVHRFFPIEGSTRRALPTPVPLVDAEIARLLAKAGSSMHRALFAFAFDEGGRPSEVVAVDWSDITWEPTARTPHGCVRVRGMKTQRADRVIPLFSLARRHLEAWWHEKGRPASGAVFCWQGRPYRGGSTFRTALIGACKRAGIEGRRIFPYLARHSMVTSARAAGATREEVAAVAGHTNPSMVDTVYDHSSAIDRVDVGRFPCR